MRATAPQTTAPQTAAVLYVAGAILAAASALAYVPLAADAGAEVSGQPLLTDRRSADRP